MTDNELGHDQIIALITAGVNRVHDEQIVTEEKIGSYKRLFGNQAITFEQAVTAINSVWSGDKRRTNDIILKMSSSDSAHNARVLLSEELSIETLKGIFSVLTAKVDFLNGIETVLVNTVSERVKKFRGVPISDEKSYEAYKVFRRNVMIFIDLLSDSYYSGDESKKPSISNFQVVTWGDVASNFRTYSEEEERYLIDYDVSELLSDRIAEVIKYSKNDYSKYVSYGRSIASLEWKNSYAISLGIYSMLAFYKWLIETK